MLRDDRSRVVSDHLFANRTEAASRTSNHHGVILVLEVLLVILDSFPDEAVVLDSNQLLWHWEVLLLQVALKTDKLGAHGAILTLL